jgi:hypothetical protein
MVIHADVDFSASRALQEGGPRRPISECRLREYEHDLDPVDAGLIEKVEYQ